MTSIPTIAADPLTSCPTEGCQKYNLKKLYSVNGSDLTCKECAMAALRDLMDTLNTFQNTYIINADEINETTLRRLLTTEVKIIEIGADFSNVKTTKGKLVVKDPADQYRNQILTTNFLRTNFLR